MPSVHSKVLRLLIAVVLLLQCINQEAEVDDHLYSVIGSESITDIVEEPAVPISDLPATDVCKDIHHTPFFKHYKGLNEDVFDYIVDNLSFNVTEARNVDFKFDPETNYLRRRRPCKISTVNRIVHFLHTMRTGDIVWDAAKDNQWNSCSASKDFCHVLYHFVKTFNADWIQDMDDHERNVNCRFPGFPTAYQALDGSHFHRRKSKRLPPGIHRRQLHLHKHKCPEGQNVQAVVNHFGVATQVVTGIPGGMSDRAASKYLCTIDRPGSILVDEGYPGSEERMQFIKSDSPTTHANARSVVERFFGLLKRMWKLVGRQFCRDARWHSLAIRAAFILTNMMKTRNGGLNEC